MKKNAKSNALEFPRPVLRAVIDIGATSARMVIAETTLGKPAHTLEFLEQNVHLGRDTFSTGKLTPATIEACVRACRDFNTLLKEYRITDPDHIRATATSAVAEAANSDLFLDRIFMATGLNIEILDTAEINRLFYFSILPLLENEPALCTGDVLAIEGGGGNTTALGLKNGSVRFAHTYRFGSARTHELLEDSPTEPPLNVITEEIHSAIRPIIEEFSGKKGVKILFLGNDARLAADQIKPDWNHTPITSLRLSSVKRLSEYTCQLSPEELVREYSLSFAAAESLNPALLAMVHIATMLNRKTVFVGKASMRDGLLKEMTDGGTWDSRFTDQIIQSAIETGLRYDFDRAHAENVAANAISLFRALQPEHQLKTRYGVILESAALLHDIGGFINNRSHHKHSQYLIENSDLFGLNRKDLNMTALIARYHRRALPKSTHSSYTALPRLDRLRVSKLAAILRVADALDRNHTQRIRNPKIKLTADRLIIRTTSSRKCTIEEIALREKGKLFEQVYGKKPVLQNMRKA